MSVKEIDQLRKKIATLAGLLDGEINEFCKALKGECSLCFVPFPACNARTEECKK